VVPDRPRDRRADPLVGPDQRPPGGGPLEHAVSIPSQGHDFRLLAPAAGRGGDKALARAALQPQLDRPQFDGVVGLLEAAPREIPIDADRVDLLPGAEQSIDLIVSLGYRNIPSIAIEPLDEILRLGQAETEMLPSELDGLDLLSSLDQFEDVVLRLAHRKNPPRIDRIGSPQCRC